MLLWRREELIMKKIWPLALAFVLIFLSAILFTVGVLEMKNPPSKGGNGSWEKPDGPII